MLSTRLRAGCITACSAGFRSCRNPCCTISCAPPPVRARTRNSLSASCGRSGTTSLILGSSIPGRHIGTSRAWDERPDFPSRSAGRCGQCSNVYEPRSTSSISTPTRCRSEGPRQIASHLLAGEGPPYDFIVVDEAQDVSVPQLRFLGALGAARPEALFFTGDLGQRIFQLPFSWRSLGVDIRGRSATLRINYRTSHQIRTQADQLLGATVADVDGNAERRSGTVSVFDGQSEEHTSELQSQSNLVCRLL